APPTAGASPSRPRLSLLAEIERPAPPTNTVTSTPNPDATPNSASPTSPHASASNPTSSTTGPNGATSPAAAATPDDSGSPSPPPSSRAASNESPGHTSSPTTSKPKLHNAWKGQHYDVTVPTIADRVAQTVAKMYLEPLVEPVFHPDSYGYRPKRSALDAVGTCRERCWRSDWVVDLDIRGFFDNIDHSLMMHAVRKHTDCPWMLRYIQRWLKAPVQAEDGTLIARDR